MTAGRFAAAAFALVTSLFFGFAAGGFLGGRVFGGGGMGYDQIADAFGGAAIGVLGGLIFAVLLIRRLSTRALWVAGTAAIAGAVLVLVVLRAFAGRA